MRTIHQLQDLIGRKVLVTGGAGRVAMAVCEVLVELGAILTVAIWGR